MAFFVVIVEFTIFSFGLCPAISDFTPTDKLSIFKKEDLIDASPFAPTSTLCPSIALFLLL